MCNRIPERTIKLVSVGAFIFFGFLGSFQVATEKLSLGIPATVGILAALAEVNLTVGKAFIVPAGTMHSLCTDGDLYVCSFLIPLVKE